MKPVAAPFDQTYRVAETASGTHWIIQADVTDPASDYGCDDSSQACIIGSNSNLNPGSQIPIDKSVILRRGAFQLF